MQIDFPLRLLRTRTEGILSLNPDEGVFGKVLLFSQCYEKLPHCRVLAGYECVKGVMKRLE